MGAVDARRDRLTGGESQGERRRIQVVACLALLVTCAYLLWRATATVDLAAWWVSIPLLVLETHAALGLGLHTFSLWDIDGQPRAARVTSTTHRIAVLIATCNEPEEVLVPTIAAAVAPSALPYGAQSMALEPVHETWVLGDGGRDWVADLAASLGARYLTRAERTDAKAGNLNNALDHIDADLVAVLDADHAATPDLLQHTVGYFDDPAVALVQTPQRFYNAGSFEDVDPRDRCAPSGRSPDGA